MYKEYPDANGRLPDLLQYKLVSYIKTCFDDIHANHVINGCHTKSTRLHNACKANYGPSIPRWATNLFVVTCPSCIRTARRQPPKPGAQPIITWGFGARGQIDLIGM